MRRLYVVASALSLGGLPALPTTPAVAQDGIYFGVHAGANFKHSLEGDVKSGGASTPFELTSNTGFMVGGALGYRWKMGLRVEGEITYRRVGNNDVTVGNATGAIDGNQNSVAFMFNGLYDFKLAERWRPYFGAGIGLSLNGLKVESISSPSFDFIKDTNPTFAYQGIAGIDFSLSQTLSLGLQYKVFGTTGTDYKFKTAPNTKADANPQLDHSVVLSIKLHFGSTE